MLVTFHETDGGDVEVVDAVERHSYTLSTASPASLGAADPDAIPFPVDGAVELRADGISVPDVPCIYVRDGDGEMLGSTEPPFERTFPAGEYCLEICTPVKLYLAAPGPLTVEADRDGKRITFGGAGSAVLGARSKHEHPAATVTTTADPVDAMRAVSTFGSALKTTSPERSFPTLRGHPPDVELGDRLHVPDAVEPPETGVTVEVPRRHRHVAVVAPLAYYLGAEVVPGASPRIVTDEGFEHALGVGRGFEREVERVLKGTFLLDCVTRTEGFYDVDLAERRAVEPVVDLDFAQLYDAPLAERLAAYLEVPYAVLEDHVPDWKLTAHVETEPSTVETLPYVVNDLAVVRTDASMRPAGPDVPEAAPERRQQSEAIEEFVRGDGGVAAVGPAAPGSPAADESMEHAWIGDGVPAGASKALPEAYRNRLDRTPTSGDIEITVVCNDRAMVEEREVVDETYGRDHDFEVTVHERLTTDELRDVLARDAAFFHYIGHIDAEGFGCTDGALDAADLEATGVDSFLLNACESYDQGEALVEAGAVGGIVTLSEVVNEGAVDIGAALARLLNNGYPLRPALDIAREASYMGGRYIVIGDGNVSVAQQTISMLSFLDLEQTEEGYDLEMTSYSSVTGGMGTMVIPYVDGVDTYYLGPGTIDTFSIDQSELKTILDMGDVPLMVGGELYWSTEFDPEKT